MSDIHVDVTPEVIHVDVTPQSDIHVTVTPVTVNQVVEEHQVDVQVQTNVLEVTVSQPEIIQVEILRGLAGQDGKDATVTKESVEAVLVGDITSHTHSSITDGIDTVNANQVATHLNTQHAPSNAITAADVPNIVTTEYVEDLGFTTGPHLSESFVIAMATVL